MLFDFGKIKSGVSVEQAKVQVEQANVLVSVDTLALDVAQTIVNIQRYLQLNKIAEQQIAGIQRIQDILTCVQMRVSRVKLTQFKHSHTYKLHSQL